MGERVCNECGHVQPSRRGSRHCDECHGSLIPSYSKKMGDWVQTKKTVPCFDCGVSYPTYVMDFDHREPQRKNFTISQARGLGKTIDEVAKEIDKCDVVCANCHRERTHGGRKSGQQDVAVSLEKREAVLGW